MGMRISKSYGFEAAHRLPMVPEGHKCSQLHGHSYQIEIELEGPVDPKMGWVCDYADITAAWEPLRKQLDHHFLNEIPGLENPTSELLAIWIYDRLKPALPLLKSIFIHETCTSCARYEP